MAVDHTALARLDPALERSRQSAARLLNRLAGKLRIKQTAREAAIGQEQAAQYAHSQPMRDVGGEIGRFLRRNPVPAISIAVVAGYLAARSWKTTKRPGRL